MCCCCQILKNALTMDEDAAVESLQSLLEVCLLSRAVLQRSAAYPVVVVLVGLCCS